MQIILIAFIAVSIAFAIAAIATGLQAMIRPIGFSHSFGIPVVASANSRESKGSTKSLEPAIEAATTYISLMGVRQLATGIILLLFAFQRKWTEMAIMLSVLGIVVAGTDGAFLLLSGARSEAIFHAIPGVLIAMLASVTLLTTT